MAVQDESNTGLAEDLALLAGEGEAEIPEETIEEEVIPESEAPDEEEEAEEQEEKPEEEEIKPLPGRPTIKQLNAEFPDLLKKYPSLKDSIFREAEFSKVFPTVDDAKEAAGESETLRTLRDPALNGDILPILNAVKAADEKSLEKIASTILPTLNKLSPDLYWKAGLPLMENIVRALYSHGAQMGDNEAGNNHKNSAHYLAQFLFGEDAQGVLTGKKSFLKQDEPSEEAKKLETDRAAFDAEKFHNFRGDVESSCESQVQAAILERGVGNKLKIDPNGTMSKWMKDNVTASILTEVNKQLASDPEHMAKMKSLWSRARADGYRGDWKSRITSAYLERAKSLLPSIRTRLVSEALGTSPVVPQNGVPAPKRREPVSGKPSGVAPKVYNPREVDYKKSSDLDIIMGNAKTRN